jgi:galactokinase
MGTIGADACSVFRERYRREPRMARAPGRVNLIGEHTDYNDGFVLPVAIDRYCLVAFEANRDRLLRGYSLAEEEEREMPLDGLAPSGSWLDYAAGTVLAHIETGTEIPGMDFVVGGDLPIGAGLSSSAAFELAVARAVAFLSGAAFRPENEARLSQRAENDFVGVPCGIMDQMAIALAREGTALLLDCRDLSFEHVPIPESFRVVVLDTGTRRKLATSAYEERRKSCEDAARLLGVPKLRDATPDSIAALPESLRSRARHVVEENRRTLEMARALAESDGSRVGRLMAESHQSLRTLFEVSSPALDAMVKIASRHPAAVGARMTGAGFGGSAVALVHSKEAESFVREVSSEYVRETANPGRLHVCRAVSGASILP